MSIESLQEEVNETKEKYERVLSQFENYKREAKQLEEFLEQQSTKKQGQIRKMKEESILKEKNFKLMKSEIGQLQTENATLKEQAKLAQKPAEESSELINKLQEEIAKLKMINNQLTSERLDQITKIERLKSEIIKIDSEWEGKIDCLNKELLEKKQQIDNLKAEKQKIVKQINEKTGKGKQESEKKIAPTELQRKESKKQIEVVRETYDKEKQKLEQRIRRAEQLNSKTQKALRQSKSKIKDLLEENQSLQYKLSNSNGSNMQSPSIIKQTIEQETEWDYNKISYACLLLTKPHYISPFLQIYEDKNLIKIYKSTRSGCFQKSMGCYKHKVDKIVFDQDFLLQPIINKILQSEEDSHHSIIFFGVKKSNKKYLMSKLLAGLKQFITEKLNNCENNEIQSIYMKRSAQQEKNYTEKGNDKETILQVIDKVISLGYKNDKKSEYSLVSSRKVVSKPKVRYFSIRINQFSLEIGTTSFTNLATRDKVNAINMLNNILYSKLPDILQSSMSQKHVILTLNPIVDLYQDCKNTLSVTNCKSAPFQKDDDQWKDWKNSPVRDQLNNVAKKKLQTFERENQQTSIKIKKLQDECVYFKHRFDQLECRLKNLLNTHQGQNSYLKKSPVTLSYQKLLKFVHSVQSRTSTNGSNLINSGTRSGFMNIDKDESIDAL